MADSPSGAGAERWWLDREPRINGIFKGGGAKGLMYAGAVQAVDEHGQWFRAVSGASAGAITATLIAAGLTVEELGGAVPEAMKSVRKMFLGDLVASPIVRVGKLQKWLQECLRQQLSKFAPGVAVGEARLRLRERAVVETRNRELVRRMLAAPADFKWVKVSRQDVGEPGCGHWHSRPHLGPIGMLMGWWRVKVSSGCPLPGRLAAVEQEDQAQARETAETGPEGRRRGGEAGSAGGFGRRPTARALG